MIAAVVAAMTLWDINAPGVPPTSPSSATFAPTTTSQTSQTTYPPTHPVTVIANAAGTAAHPITNKTLPYLTTNFADGSWALNWGNLSTSSGALDFGATSSTTGGTVLLDGSSLWTNYDAEADLTWVDGETVSIIARFADMKNFAYCNFGNHYVSIVARADGNDTTLGDTSAATTTIASTVGASQTLGVRVYGAKIACTIGGKDVVTAVLSKNSPTQGGLGFTAWDPTAGKSRIIVNRLSVVPLATDDIVIASAQPTTAAAPPAPTTPPAQTPPTNTPLALPHSESNFTDDVNWIGTWGNVTTTNAGTLAISAMGESGGTGGSAYLQNADAWSNYNFTVTLDWPKGENFMLFANYIDDQNFVACSFTQLDSADVQIALQQRIKGIDYQLAKGQDQNLFAEGRSNIVASVQLHDTRGTCTFNGHSVSNTSGDSYTVNPPFRGSIGFSTWDPSSGNAQIIVKKILVQNGQ